MALSRDDSKLDIAFSLNKSSMPGHFSLSARKLSKKCCMRVAVELHTSQSALNIALIGIEEAVKYVSGKPPTISLGTTLTGIQA